MSFDDAAVGVIASKYVRGGWRGFSRAAPPGSCLGLSRPGRALRTAQGALESLEGRGETSGSDLANFGDKKNWRTLIWTFGCSKLSDFDGSDDRPSP